MSDQDLLRQYAEQGSEEAFVKVVRQYVDLVYGAAYRQLRDADLAKDVSQRVFVILARKAAKVARLPHLAAWLFRCTRLEACNVQKGQRLRTHYETRAIAMQSIEQEANSPWQSAGPLIDEAIDHLRKSDAEAVLLRYFEQKSVADVARALGIKEDAAQKRIRRSLEKIRSYLVRHGLRVSSPMLVGALSLGGSYTAPSGMAASIASASLATAAASSTSTFSLGVLFQLMPTAKFKVGVAASFIAVAGGAPILLQYQQFEKAQDEIVELRGELLAASVNYQQQLNVIRNSSATAMPENDVRKEIISLSNRADRLLRQNQALNRKLGEAMGVDSQTKSNFSGSDLIDALSRLKAIAKNPGLAPHERLSALRELRRLNERSSDVVLAMAQLLEQVKDSAIKADIIRNLDGVTDSVLKPILLAAIGSDSSINVRDEAAEALAYYRNDPEVVSALYKAARQGNHKQLARVAVSSLHQGEPVQKIQQALQATSATDWERFYLATDQLNEFEGFEDLELEVMTDLLRISTQADVREQALEELGKHHFQKPQIQHLIRQSARNDPDQRVRKLALMLLNNGGWYF